MTSLYQGENILSIDVEEIHHIEYADGVDVYFHQTPENLPPILEQLKEYKAKATFFLTGEVAEKTPEIIKLIVDEGHEVGFHGYSHKLVNTLGPDEFEKELVRFGLILEKYEVKCIGFRSPTFSLRHNMGWFFELLLKHGYRYDSSVFPVKTQLYGHPKAPTRPYRPDYDRPDEINPNNDFWEYPLLVFPLNGFRIPAAGGFYFRVLPQLTTIALRNMNNQGHPGVVYIHNWELDQNTPRLELSKFRSFVTYWNINQVRDKIGELLKQFKFTSIEKHMEKYLE